MRKYKVGDVVWVAEAGNNSVKKTCLVCYGNKYVKLILGNGDIYKSPCRYCAPGIEVPRGYVVEYEFTSGVRKRTIDAIEIKVTQSGEEVEYRSDCYILGDENIFDTREEAEERVKEICAKLEKDQSTRAEHIKQDVKKSYSWNVGYHLRNVKRMRRDIEYHEKMAVLCKNKVKQGNPDGEVKAERS